MLFQKSLSRSLQRPETRGERKGKYKREKLNSCEKGRKKQPSAPGAPGSCGERDGARGRPPLGHRHAHTNTHNHTRTGGRMDGRSGAELRRDRSGAAPPAGKEREGWRGVREAPASAVSPARVSACPRHACPYVLGTCVRTSSPPQQPDPGSAGCWVNRHAAACWEIPSGSPNRPDAATGA